MTTRHSRLCALLLLAGSLACPAAELFVDCAAGTAAGPGTADTPFRTIQQAVDKAAAGDTVTVLPGVYDQGTASFTASGVTSANRVLIERNLTLRSRDGAATTHIVGAPDPASANGMGPDAVRCIAVRGDKSAVTSVVIQGFTIRDGATQTGGDSIPVRGGGVLNYQNQPGIDNIEKIHVVDCVLQDCVGTRGGAAYGVAAYRCRFFRNRAQNYGAAMRQGNAYNCLFVENGTLSGGTSLNVGVLAYGHRVVNCTIANNRSTSAVSQFNTSGQACVSNCVLVSNAAVHESSASKIWTSVTDGTFPEETGNVQVLLAMTDNPQFLAPAAGDYRPIADAELVKKNPARADVFAGLSADTATDLLGRPRVTDGVVLPGCYQDAVVPAGGKTTVAPAAGGTMYVEGFPVLRSCYFYPDAWPRTYAVTYAPDAGKDLVYYACQNRARWPTMDGRYHYLPPRDPAATISFVPTFGPVLHVAPDGDDAVADGTSDHPYSLQGGVAAAKAPSVLLAAPGDYATGSMRYQDGHLASRVVLASSTAPVRLRSVAGAAATVIRGAADPAPAIANDLGLGPDALRCAFLTGNNAIQGFTLTDGHSSIASGDADDNSKYTVRGGGVAAFDANSGVLDCVLENNFASRGAAMFGATLERCTLRGNGITAKGNSITRTGNIFSSVIADNEVTQNAVVGQSTLAVNCTVARNRTANTAATLASSAYARNCVFAGNTSQYDASSTTIRHSVYEVGNLGEDCVRETTRFADAEQDDWRLRATTAAVYRGVPDTDVWEGRNVVDFFGTPFTFNDEGRMHAGAVETLAPEVRVESNVPGDSANVAGLADVGPDGLVVTATRTDRPFVGFLFNGVTQTVAGASLTISPEQAAALAPLTVTVAYQTTWYVDAAGGSDEQNGFTPETAKRTLTAALEHAVTGDTVVALPGDYAEGAMLESAEMARLTGSGTTAPVPTVRARAVLTNGVSLVSRDGPAVTFITGANATTGADGYGRGPDAIRCVWMGADARLRGFTVRGGRTGQEVKNPDTGNNLEYADSHGAGVLAASDNTSTIEDCVFTNNVAIRGAAGRWGNYRRCSFFDNRSSATCPTVRDGRVFSCYIGRNYGSHTVYSVRVENTTIAEQSPDGATTVAYGTQAQYSYLINCLVAKGTVQSVGTIRNCAFGEGSSIPEAAKDAAAGNILGEVELDDAGRPVFGHNVGIDFGDPALTTDAASLEADISGGPRVSNGRMDVGCFEYDWRPRYAADLCSARFAVTDATPAVHETDDRGVALPADARLDGIWSSGGLRGAYLVRAEVTGTGVLEISVNGEVVESVAGPTDGVRELRYTSATFAEAENAVSFAYHPAADDTGCAVLRGLVHSDGTLLIFR